MIYKSVEKILEKCGIFKSANVYENEDKMNAVKVIVNIGIMLTVVLIIVKGVMILL